MSPSFIKLYNFLYILFNMIDILGIRLEILHDFVLYILSGTNIFQNEIGMHSQYLGMQNVLYKKTTRSSFYYYCVRPTRDYFFVHVYVWWPKFRSNSSCVRHCTWFLLVAFGNYFQFHWCFPGKGNNLKTANTFIYQYVYLFGYLETSVDLKFRHN
jgi:hypothetical protein